MYLKAAEDPGRDALVRRRMARIEEVCDEVRERRGARGATRPTVPSHEPTEPVGAGTSE